MSTILKALRKLEREKATPADSRTLREAVATGGSDSDPRSARTIGLFVGLALLFGLGLGSGVLLVWPDGDGADGEQETLAQTAELPAPAVISASAPVPPATVIPARHRGLDRDQGTRATNVTGYGDSFAVGTVGRNR